MSNTMKLRTNQNTGQLIGVAVTVVFLTMLILNAISY
jgi:hypothetical protein